MHNFITLFCYKVVNFKYKKFPNKRGKFFEQRVYDKKIRKVISKARSDEIKQIPVSRSTKAFTKFIRIMKIGDGRSFAAFGKYYNVTTNSDD